MKIILSIGLFFLLYSCSGKPNEHTIKEMIVASLKDCSSDIIFENFRKINGRDLDANHYEVEIEYDLILKKELTVPNSNTFDKYDKYIMCVTKNFQPTTTNTDAFYGWGYRRYAADSKVHVKKTIKYQKTDNGWIVSI